MKWSEPPGVVERAAAVALAVACGIMYSAPLGLPGAMLLLPLMGVGLVLGGIWTIRVVSRARLLPSPRRHRWFRWSLVPLLGLVAAMSVVLPFDDGVRFAIGRARFEAFARRFAAGQVDPAFDGWVGLYHVRDIESRDGAVRICTTWGAAFDQSGFYFAPESPPRPYPGGYEEIFPLGGGWYEFYFDE